MSSDESPNNGNGAAATKRPLEEDAGDANNGGASAKAAKRDNPGTVLFSGATDWSEVGRKTNNLPRSSGTIWRPVRLQALEGVDVERVVSGPTSAHILALCADGRVFAWGRNEKGQLGLGHAKDKKCPTLVDALADKKVVKAATGKNHTLFLTDEGEVFAAGDNRSGQAAGGKKEATATVPAKVQYDGPPAKEVACGGEFSLIVDTEGGIWTWGHPEHGQLGHNSDGSYLEKAGKVTFDFVYSPAKVTSFVEKDPKSKGATPVFGVKAVAAACGQNHCVLVDDKNRAFSWGFGGYGRLGHAETGNEMVPRLIKFFDGPRRGVTKVWVGGQFNMASAEIKGTTYMWGQYNSGKEANMYPKPVQDLSGWMDVRAFGCSMKGWIVAADDAVIGAVPSPCFGELAMGDMKKSSANPVEIKTLNDIYVSDVTMGISHSVFVAKPDSDAGRKKLAGIQVLDQSKDEE